MENLWQRYPYPSQPSSWAGACLPQYIGTDEGVQIRTCTDFGNPAATLFDAFPSKSPHGYRLLGTSSSGSLMQLHHTANYDDPSSPMTQCWQKFVANFGDQGPTLTCNSPANSLMNSRNPFPRPTRNRRWKKAAAAGGQAHVHKLVERQRRDTMKALCSTLISLLPEEYHKKKHTLSDQLLEAVKYIDHLQDTLIELEKRRDMLSLSSTVKPFSSSTCVYKTLQASQAGPSNITETFPTIRVSKFSSGIQVTANTFKNQIDFSSLLSLLEEAGVEVVSAASTAINDRVFYNIQLKLPEILHFDSGVLHRRIDQLMKGNLPSNSLSNTSLCFVA